MLCKYDEARGMYFICGRTPSELKIFLFIVNYITELRINLDSNSGEKLKMKSIDMLKGIVNEKDLKKYGNFRVYRYFFQLRHRSGFLICFKE